MKKGRPRIEDSVELLSENEKAHIRKVLLDWYSENRRLLPWRGDKLNSVEPPPLTPYGIWISEAMCQQTRVQTVIPYWSKWMAIFPTIDDLARASPDDVNRIWAGLGYYNRAQNLLLAAKKLVAEFNSQLPSSVEELKSIPGIGPYTAGAIASIAFNRVEAAVDGNVYRVLSRLRTIEHPIGSKELESVSWQLAKELVDPDCPGSFNQAMMEFGATVCKPKSPNCQNCPLQSVCRVYSLVASNGQMSNDAIEELPLSVDSFPKRKLKAKSPELVFCSCVFRRITGAGNSETPLYLLVRRPPSGLLANQWEFPTVELAHTSSLSSEGDDSKKDVARTYDASDLWVPFVCRFQNVLGIDLTKLQPQDNAQTLSPVIHVFSHQKHITHCLLFQVDSDKFTSSAANNFDREVRWMTARQIEEAGMTTGCKKILKAALGSDFKIEGKGVGTKRKHQEN